MDAAEKQARVHGGRVAVPAWEQLLTSVERALNECQQRLDNERLRGDAANRARVAAQQRGRVLEHTLFRLEEEFVRLEESFVVAQAAEANASSRIGELESLLADRESALAELRQRDASLTERITELESRREDTGRLAVAEHEIECLQRSLTERSRELAEARAAAALATSETQARVQALETECELLQARLSEERSRLRLARNENEELERQSAQLQGELAAARAQFEESLRASQQEISVWRDTNAALEKERDALQARLHELEKVTANAADAEYSTRPQLGKRPRPSLLASPAQRIPIEVKDPWSGRPSPFFGSVQRRLLQTPLVEVPASETTAGDQSTEDKETPVGPSVVRTQTRRSAEHLAREQRHTEYLRSLLEELEARLPLVEEQKRRFHFAIGQFDRMNRALQETSLASERWKQRAAAAEHERAELLQQIEHLQEERERHQRHIQELEEMLASSASATTSGSMMAMSAEQLAQLEAELDQIRQQRQEFEGVMSAVVKQRDLYRQLLLRCLRGEQVVAP
ncbi:hypothetical protein CCYA_CCYA08G2375 [Cyanidiococcus yangmingshanensis]|nr:hypothetical protein CCYA_CCYA08G2375 [Cyanidiococcus yangmingshanensis]